MSEADSRLRDLQELHAKGLLTPEELAQQRAEVLQSMEGTQAVPRIPISGKTQLEENPKPSTAPPIVIQPPFIPRAVPVPSGSRLPRTILALCGTLGMLGVCGYIFSDDLQALIGKPKRKNKVEKKARALPPADICEIEWEIERGEPYEPNREDYTGSMDMSDCLDRFDSLKTQAEEEDWLSFGECMDHSDSLSDLGECEFKLDQDRRDSRRKDREERAP
jgi:hypothetical protein